jgi:hypothetical protein
MLSAKQEIFMTPEELAKYRADKLANERAAEAVKEADKLAERDRIANQNLAAESALKMALPYLAKAKAAISSLDITPVSDTSSKIAGINLRLGNASAQIMKSPLGDITAVTMNKKQGPTGKPFNAIRSLADLTDENLSLLVKTLIDGENS